MHVLTLLHRLRFGCHSRIFVFFVVYTLEWLSEEETSHPPFFPICCFFQAVNRKEMTSEM